MSTLGSRLLELRKQKGFTQEQLAEKLNVTNQSVSKWEKDINAPDITLLVELADLLETSVDYLLGRGGNKPVVTTTQKNIDQLVFKIRILSANKDKVNINLPLGIVRLLAKDGELEMLKDKKIDIDVTQLIALAEQGISATQATISRDIRELQLVKQHLETGVCCYRLPEQTPVSDHLLRDSILRTDCAGQIAVLHCRAGMAQAVCAAVDAAQDRRIVGTLAGEDTIFVLMRSEEQAAIFAKQYAVWMQAGEKGETVC